MDEFEQMKRKGFCIEDAAFAVKKGYITVLVGENGAGFFCLEACMVPLIMLLVYLLELARLLYYAHNTRA